MAKAVAAIALALGACSATQELTPENFDSVVFASGKAAFVKFLAPWCGHCKSMKPDWDALAEEFASSDSVVVADVDCTGAGEPLCERFGVEGFPTIKSFSPPDTEGEDYEGGRELDELREFAKSLGPGCSAATKDKCSAEDLAELEAMMARSPAELAAELDDLKAQLKSATDAHDELLKSLQDQYEKSEASVTALKKELAPKIKKLRAATAPAPAASEAPAKDEV